MKNDDDDNVRSRVVNRARRGNISIAKGRLWDDDKLKERHRLYLEKYKIENRVRSITLKALGICLICRKNPSISNINRCSSCNIKYEKDLIKRRIPEYAPEVHPDVDRLIVGDFLSDFPETTTHGENRIRYKTPSRRTYQPGTRPKRNSGKRRSIQRIPEQLLEVSQYMGRPYYGEEMFSDLSRWEEQKSSRGIIYK